MGSIPNGNDPKSVHLDIILEPEDLGAAASLIEDLASLGPQLAEGGYKTRVEALTKARALAQALETPRDTMIWQLWGHQTLVPSITLGVEAGLFKLMAQDDGPHKVTDLAAKLEFDPALLARIMRHLSAMGHLKEVDQDVYETTKFSKSLSLPIMGNGWPCIARLIYPTSLAFPEYLRQTGYKEPRDMASGNFQFAKQTDLNFFAWGVQNPPLGEHFNHHMGGYSYGRPRWMDEGFYPVRERLLDGFDDAEGRESVVLVDVGGNHGHDLQAFLRKIPDVPGRLVLQDLPAVVKQIGAAELDGRIERMGHDFFTEQPVKGARAYYLHSVLHDWPDETALKILARLKEAMKPGYSRLLINENVIPLRNAHWEATSLDIVMSVLVSAKERTRGDWDALLEKAGFEIVGVWSYMNGMDSVIECQI